MVRTFFDILGILSQTNFILRKRFPKASDKQKDAVKAVARDLWDLFYARHSKHQ